MLLARDVTSFLWKFVSPAGRVRFHLKPVWKVPEKTEPHSGPAAAWLGREGLGEALCRFDLIAVGVPAGPGWRFAITRERSLMTAMINNF